jgi:hypothetical protein
MEQCPGGAAEGFDVGRAVGGEGGCGCGLGGGGGFLGGHFAGEGEEGGYVVAGAASVVLAQMLALASLRCRCMSSGAFKKVCLRLAIWTEHNAICEPRVPRPQWCVLLFARLCRFLRHLSYILQLVVAVKCCDGRVMISKLFDHRTSDLGIVPGFIMHHRVLAAT